jgi:hypothetical protein
MAPFLLALALIRKESNLRSKSAVELASLSDLVLTMFILVAD